MITCARSASRWRTRPTAFAVSPPMPASISSNTSVSPPATAAIASATRDSSPPDAVSATGPNGMPAFGRMRKTASSAPVAPMSRSRTSQVNSPSPMPTSCNSTATATANPGAAVARLVAQLECERVHARLGRLDRGGGSRCRVDALVERRQLLARLGRARQQLVVARDAEAALRLRDAVEACLQLFQPSRLGLERRKERAQLGRGLAQAELDVAQLVAGALELGRQPLERSDGPLGDRDQTGRALSLLGCQRFRRRGRSLGELGDVPQPLAVAA